MVQDTAWEGYEEIPTWIMQGYGTLAVGFILNIETFQSQVLRQT